jgi:exo-beta-1,3-glucanase (GH17 family)
MAACDVVMMNGFPYWQGAEITKALQVFQKAITDTNNAINYAIPHGAKPKFIIGETGWPSAGASFGKGDPSPQNQQRYWKEAACWLQTTSYGWFWFSAFNEPDKGSVVEQNFGIGT